MGAQCVQGLMLMEEGRIKTLSESDGVSLCALELLEDCYGRLDGKVYRY